MNILFYEWETIGRKDAQDVLIKMGHRVDSFQYKFVNDLQDTVFEEKLNAVLTTHRYDIVMSFDFFPVISNVCERTRIKYVAWIWDSPLFHLFFRSVYNTYNYLFIFDKTLFYELKNLNVKNIYYLSLAVNVERLDKLILSDDEYRLYNHDISFVGQLYEKNPYNQIKYLPEYLKGYFDGIMKAQIKIHGYNFIPELLTEDILKELYQYLLINIDEEFIWDTKNIVVDRFLNPKITELERKHILNLLSDYYNLVLYTDSNNEGLSENINFNGYIDYYSIMPKVFRGSKINLNLTLRTIKTGIPLRVYDVLGAGGFLITNYQSELAEHFEIGKDLVCYESEEDLIYKVDYYLENEDKRREIAANGYNKVKKCHNYEIRLQEIIDTVTMN